MKYRKRGRDSELQRQSEIQKVRYRVKNRKTVRNSEIRRQSEVQRVRYRK